MAAKVDRQESSAYPKPGRRRQPRLPPWLFGFIRARRTRWILLQRIERGRDLHFGRNQRAFNSNVPPTPLPPECVSSSQPRVAGSSHILIYGSLKPNERNRGKMTFTTASWDWRLR